MQFARHIFPSILLLALLAGSAQADSTRHEFTLGLKDKTLRTRPGAEALASRLHQRLQAALLHNYSMQIDGARGEVRVAVTSDVPEAIIEDILVARSRVEFLPATRSIILDDLQGLLPEGVTLGRAELPAGRESYLFSPSRKTLEDYVSTMALGDLRVLVGPVQYGGGGARTWTVDRATKGALGAADAVTVGAGAHPNYHFLTVWWKELPSLKAGDRWLLVVDGRVVTEVAASALSDDGRVIIRMPKGPAARQRERSRWLAARLAAPHPCDIAVVSHKVRQTR